MRHPIARPHPPRRLLAALALLLASQAHAATFVVNTTHLDLADHTPGDGICDADPVAPGAQCTLRAAVMEANATPQADIIVLPLNATIPLTLAGAGGAASGDLDLTAPVTLTGAPIGFPADYAALPRIQAGFADRIFDVGQDIQVTLRGLVLASGTAPGAAATTGGALRITAGGASVHVDRVRFVANSAAIGAAVANSGTLLVEGSDFAANVASNSASAIYTGTGASTTLRNSSIREIRTEGGDHEALRVAEGGTLVVENSDIDGDSQLGAPPPTPTTGIRALRPALLVVRNSTLVGFSRHGLSLVADGATTARVYNSVLAGSGLSDCSLASIAGPPADLAFAWNLVQISDCAPALGAGNVVGQAPLLGPVQAASGRFTVSRRPLLGSPALDGGAPLDAPGSDPLRLCLPADMHGTPRPLDGDADGEPRCDIGAIEAAALSSSTFVVNLYDVDLADANPGDGICDADLATPGAQCTLRAAVMEANAKPGPDRIEFAPGPSGNMARLTIAGAGGAGVGDLDVTEQLSIEGPAVHPPSVVVQAQHGDRIFDVALPAGQAFALRHVRLTGGNASGPGGALRSHAALTQVQGAVFTFNQSLGGGGAVFAQGGALVVEDSHFASNRSDTLGGALRSAAQHSQVLRSSFLLNRSDDGFDRAAVRLEDGASALLLASTLHGNDGGLTADGVASVDLRASTITDNDGFGLRMRDDPAPGASTLRVRGTILAGNTVNNCQLVGSFTGNLMAYNLLGAANPSCAPLGSGSLVLADPALTPALRRSPGSTAMMRFPLHGSPVVDAIPAAAGEDVCGGADGRGQPRPTDSDGDGVAACEIGAVELTAAEAGPRQFVVDVTLDDVDGNPGDGVCSTGSNGPLCSLRAAIMEANALPGPDHIVLLPSAVPYALTIADGPDPAPAVDGDLDITDGVRITGVLDLPEDRPVIQASHGDRHFRIHAVHTPVVIEGLRLSGGTTAQHGGAIAVDGGSAVTLRQVQLSGNTADAGGGALSMHQSTLLLEQSDLANNGTVGEGGAIRSSASFLTIRRSSVRGSVDLGPAADQREAIHASGNGSTWIVNSTLAGNAGNGVRVVDGDLEIANATLQGNERYGVVFARVDGRNLLVRNSAFTGNALGSCLLTGLGSPGIATDGYNLTQGIGCALQNGSSNIQTAEAVLGPLLAPAGEFSAYHVPLPDSPLRDAGHPDISALGCEDRDQRGSPRPLDGNGDGIGRCDIGAIEADAVPDVLFANGFE